jgi:hypothetical protein
MIITFITTLAWIFGILSTLLVIFKVFCTATYSDLDQLKDQINGIKRSWPIKTPGIISIISWAWIISLYCSK